MKYSASEPNGISSNGSKPLVRKSSRDRLGKIFLILVILAFLFLATILLIRTSGDKIDQKVSQEIRNGLIEKGSMKGALFLPEAAKIDNENIGTIAPAKEKTAEEDKIESDASKNTEPEVKKDIAKNTATVKPPVIPKKAVSKAISCKHENDKPKYSKTKGKHMDEDCCPDPDEWPKPGCVYSEKGLDLMLSGPPKKKK